MKIKVAARKNLSDLVNEGLICLQPFTTVEFNPDGEVFTCCPPFINCSIGNLRHNTLEEIWNGNTARYIRRRLYHHKWKGICNPICGWLSAYLYCDRVDNYHDLESQMTVTERLAEEIREKRDYLETPPTVFKFSNSTECNLSCIMCARESQQIDRALVDRTASMVTGYLPTARQVIMTGYGDPFARKDTRDIIIGYKGKNVKFNIITNGLLLPRYWNDVSHQQFNHFTVSVDAPVKELYEKIRRGGKWSDLMEALELLKLVSKDRFTVSLNMTVMRCNYREIPEFIDFAKSFGFIVSFQRIHGHHGDHNIFDPPDWLALKELSDIVNKEQKKYQDDVTVEWNDLLEFSGKVGYVGIPNGKSIGDHLIVRLKGMLGTLAQRYRA